MIAEMRCPKCNAVDFAEPFEFVQHLQICFAQNSQKPKPVKKKQKQDLFQYQKVPKDDSNTTFKWQKKAIMDVNPKLIKKSQNNIKKLSFQQKQYWFRNNIELNRVQWQKGSDYMRLQKENILMGSLVEVKKVNMHKQVKIQFVGDKVNDAGGLLRQWIYLVIKQMFDDSTGLFDIANTDDIMYKLKLDRELDEQFSTQLYKLLGIIIGKCLFEKIPLMCYLDRTILRQLCEQSVKMEDIYGYDKDLYKSWNHILNTQQISDLQTYFVIHKIVGNQIQQIQLMEDGRNILVDNENKNLYVDMCIQIMTTQLVQRSILALKQGISTVIPNKFLSVFQPYELEMLLYGVPFIDIDDWKNNTQYKAPYSESHKVIKWFWAAMKEFDQQQLANILRFCTGSSRTPIHGFKKLQTNRGNCSKFLIESSKFSKANPYPKGHTCFNRLDLPIYSKQSQLQTYLIAISKNTLDGVFGLD